MNRLICAVHNEPLASCPCETIPGVVPMVYKVKPVIKERDEEYKRYLSVPQNE